MANRRPTWEAGQYVFIYDDESTIAARGKVQVSASTARSSLALTAALAQCWAGPYKILFAGPGVSPDGKQVGKKMLSLDLRRTELAFNLNLRRQWQGVKGVLNPMRGRKKRIFCLGVLASM